ncbi:MAG TPA: hypothetical protein VKB46_08370 [Pyrinomonadaceae bacterium]|nr:hypothetical protein [Pyrinomonadaceae bacterium]
MQIKIDLPMPRPCAVVADDRRYKWTALPYRMPRPCAVEIHVYLGGASDNKRKYPRRKALAFLER